MPTRNRFDAFMSADADEELGTPGQAALGRGAAGELVAAVRGAELRAVRAAERLAEAAESRAVGVARVEAEAPRSCEAAALGTLREELAAARDSLAVGPATAHLEELFERRFCEGFDSVTEVTEGLGGLLERLESRVGAVEGSSRRLRRELKEEAAAFSGALAERVCQLRRTLMDEFGAFAACLSKSVAETSEGLEDLQDAFRGLPRQRQSRPGGRRSSRCRGSRRRAEG